MWRRCGEYLATLRKIPGQRWREPQQQATFLMFPRQRLVFRLHGTACNCGVHPAAAVKPGDGSMPIPPVKSTTPDPNASSSRAGRRIETKLQTIWNCRWSRPAKLARHAEVRPVFVCGRTGGERCVSQSECEVCPHWIYE